LSEVTWKPREIRTGNGRGGTWKKGALSNNVRGWPLGGTGEAWKHGDLVVTMVRLRWGGKLRRVDAPEGMIIGFISSNFHGSGKSSSDDGLEPRRAALESEKEGFGRKSSSRGMWTGFGQLFEGEEMMRNQADPMAGSRVQ